MEANPNFMEASREMQFARIRVARDTLEADYPPEGQSRDSGQVRKRLNFRMADNPLGGDGKR
jgi:hypothetical protein